MATLLQSSTAWVNAQIAAGNTSATLSDATCMLKGLPGIDAAMLFNTGQPGTLVANGSKGIVEFSAHYSLSVGNTSGPYTVTNVAYLPNTDIGYAVLDKKVTGISPIKIVPTNSVKMGSWAGLPFFWCVIHTNRMQLLEVVGIWEFSNRQFIVGVAPSQAHPTWAIGTHLIGGDSSSPAITVVNGTAVLLCTATSANAGTDIESYAAAAQSLWLSTFGITDAYTVVDLSGFDDAGTETTTSSTNTEGVLTMVAYLLTGDSDGDLGNPLNYSPNGIPGAIDTVTASNFDNLPALSGTITCLSFDLAGFGGGPFQGTCTFNCVVTGGGATIDAVNSVFNGAVSGAQINAGTFNAPVTVDGGDIRGGTFNNTVTTDGDYAIYDGVFNRGIKFASSTVLASALMPSLFPVTSPVATPVT